MTEVERKLVELETNLGLLQRDYEQQNEVILQLTRQNQQLEQSVRRLVDQVATLQLGGEGDRLMKDEKPPHY